MISGPSPIMRNGPVDPQNDLIENPSATVGIMNGMSARVSKILVHFVFVLTISHAIGKAASRSTVAMKNATMNDQLSAALHLVSNDSSARTGPILSSLNRIPRMGGNRISARKRAIPVEYKAKETPLRLERMSSFLTTPVRSE